MPRWWCSKCGARFQWVDAGPWSPGCPRCGSTRSHGLASNLRIAVDLGCLLAVIATPIALGVAAVRWLLRG